MPASFLGQVTGTTTATLPTHQAGDFFVALAARSGSSTPPTVPTANGWVEVVAGGANSLGYALATLTCDSSSESTGTFANATGLIIVGYRPASGSAIVIGNFATALSGSGISIPAPAVALIDQGGTSWVAQVFAHRSADLTGMTTPPAGMTNRPTALQNSNGTLVANDTNGPVAQWQTQSVTYGGTAAAYRAFSVELRVLAVAPPAKNFYFRTNQRVGGGFYLRTNDLNAAGMNTPAATLSASGIVFQTVIGAGIVTDNTSAYNNLNFTPVNGDQVSLPIRWQGSTVSLAADGRFIISPALPDGTTMPRLSYDVSANARFADTLTINSGVNTGFVSVPQITASGSGTIFPRAIGTGGLFTTVPTVAGSGTLATNRAIKRILVSKLGVPISAGQQVTAMVVSSLNPGFTTYVHGTYTVGSGGSLTINSTALPALGSTVILILYAAGASPTGDQDLGMSARRVTVVDVNS